MKAWLQVKIVYSATTIVTAMSRSLKIRHQNSQNILASMRCHGQCTFLISRNESLVASKLAYSATTIVTAMLRSLKIRHQNSQNILASMLCHGQCTFLNSRNESLVASKNSIFCYYDCDRNVAFSKDQASE
jgi:energy-converting hydrogenase A subunit M